MEYIETPLGRVPTLKSMKMLAVMVDNISNEITRLKTQLASSVISEESLKSRINEIERAVGELADAIKNLPREVPGIREKNEIEIEIEQFVDIKEHFGRIIGQKTAKKLLKHARAGMCVLVRGPEGSGKTLLIRAFAKEKKLDLLTLPASLFDPALVNEYISKGYVPVGMLITTPRENALGWHGSTTTQTLIKKEIVIDILRKAIEQSLDLIIKSFIKKSLEE